MGRICSLKGIRLTFKMFVCIAEVGALLVYHVFSFSHSMFCSYSGSELSCIRKKMEIRDAPCCSDKYRQDKTN